VIGGGYTGFSDYILVKLEEKGYNIDLDLFEEVYNLKDGCEVL
jgi:hypothetical protein